MSVVERTCRTCGKTSEFIDDQQFFPLFETSPMNINYSTELESILEEFEIWNLNISKNDGLPQKICLNCFDSFCQVHNFRKLCIDAQSTFGEMCTGLDIFIKDDDLPSDDELLVSVEIQERFTFPGDECPKTETSEVPNAPVIPPPAEIDNDTAKAEQLIESIIMPNLTIKKFRCDYCMNFVSFDDPELLNDHYNEKHSSDKPYPCPKCPQTFDKKTKQKIHARSHYTEMITCEKCGKKFKGDETVLWEHNEYYHVNKDRDCPICGKKFLNVCLKRVQYHMYWHDDSKLRKCSFCDKKFIQTTHLAVHELTHNDQFKFKCKTCGYAYKTAKILAEHNCDEAGQYPFQCKHCPKKYINRRSYDAHIQCHKPNVVYPHCDICNITYRSTMNFRLHNYKKHGAPATQSVLNIVKKRNKKKAPIIKPYKCSKCPEEFVLHQRLVKHLKTHNEDRPFKCTLCPKTFKRMAHMKFHVDSTHLNKRKYKCTMCGWAFPLVTNLKEHMAAKHKDTKEFHCEICSHEFATKKGLKTHMLRHSEEKPFVCTVCKRGFKRLVALECHMRMHLKNAVDKTETADEPEEDVDGDLSCS